MKFIVRISFIMIFALTLVLSPQPLHASAQTPDCKPGTTGPGCEPKSGTVEAQTGAYFKKALNVNLKGGYVAQGVGMRNRGSGTISIEAIPPGSTVVSALLYWAVIGPRYMPGYYYNKGMFNNHSIKGALLGTGDNPCWETEDSASWRIWSYRANVKRYINKGGNGTYQLSGFASGYTDDSDPYTYIAPPLLEGATLVIVYKNANMPLTRIQIYNGAATSLGLEELHLNMPGINAIGLTGLSSTTFIGADGQDAGGTGSFFTQSLPTVTWAGSDGNFWDTQTVDISTMLQPPEPDFWFSVTGNYDCLTWVAQVASYASGNQDTDKDMLKDGWELNGYTSEDGWFVNLPGYGADPLHKDLFIEADYMADTSHDQLPDKAHLDDIVAVFNNAPVANPDGTPGIHIHIDTGGASNGVAAGTWPEYDLEWGGPIPHQDFLGTITGGNYDWTEFQTLKDTYFGPGREKIFHYMIFAHDLAPELQGTSGISRNGWPDSVFIKGAQDFIVSLGSWPGQGTQDAREGTFIHELGHNLGLRHGGNDHINYKPNYLSIMNYFYQVTGVYRDGAWGNFDYSRVAPISLNENKLNEVIGLGPSALNYGTLWFCPNGIQAFTASAGSNIDWDCDQDGGSETSVKVNINGDLTSDEKPIYSTLGTQINWANITFLGGGIIGSGQAATGLPILMVSNNPIKELTYEEFLKFADVIK